jgi:uncharacterized protein
MRFEPEEDREQTNARPPVSVMQKRAVAETRAIYRQADALFAPYSCPGTSECCQLAVTRREPWLWPSEWWVLLAELATTRREMPPARADGACRFLDEAASRCTVYGARPLGCRTYFCHRIQGPAQQPTAALDRLMKRLGDVNLTMSDELSIDGDIQPKPLTQWLK